MNYSLDMKQRLNFFFNEIKLPKHKDITCEIIRKSSMNLRSLFNFLTYVHWILSRARSLKIRKKKNYLFFWSRSRSSLSLSRNKKRENLARINNHECIQITFVKSDTIKKEKKKNGKKKNLSDISIYLYVKIILI